MPVGGVALMLWWMIVGGGIDAVVRGMKKIWRGWGGHAIMVTIENLADDILFVGL